MNLIQQQAKLNDVSAHCTNSNLCINAFSNEICPNTILVDFPHPKFLINKKLHSFFHWLFVYFEFHVPFIFTGACLSCGNIKYVSGNRSKNKIEKKNHTHTHTREIN